MSYALKKMTSRARAGLKEAGRLGLDLLYPRRCPMCDRPVRPFGALICPECAGLPVRALGNTCLQCGTIVPWDRAYCSGCQTNHHLFVRGCAAFSYRSMSRSLYRYKYRGRQEYASWYGMEMTGALKERVRRGRFPKPDYILPVPLSRERERKRGYNQAALLAREVAKRLRIPCREDILFRTRDTAVLKTRDFWERQENLKRAFLVYGNDVKLKSIMLIDDIYTTGATMDACAQALLAAGAENVTFLTLAIGEET